MQLSHKFPSEIEDKLEALENSEKSASPTQRQ